jgi:hypothetical protein
MTGFKNCCIATDFNVLRTAGTEAGFPRVTILCISLFFPSSGCIKN